MSKVVLMEFSNGDEVQAEVFSSIDALRRWFKNEYFEGIEPLNLLELFMQIENDLVIGNLAWTEFRAMIYKDYEVHQ